MRGVNLDSRNRFLDRLDREGFIDYGTGDDFFDGQIGLKWHNLRPQENDFANKYSPTEIQADLDIVERITNSSTYQKERDPAAVKAEYSIVEGLGARGWLGPDSSAFITSKFDDIKAGADVLVTLVDPENPDGEDLVFVIDVTTARDYHTLERKINSEMKRLYSNNRTRLKYFRGLKKPVNRYVVGISPEQANELADALVSGAEGQEIEKVVQYELMEELIHQAQRQMEFVLKNYDLVKEAEISFDDLMNFFSDQRADIAKKLPAEAFESVRVNHAVILAVLEQKEILENEKGVTDMVNRRNSFEEEPVHYLTGYELAA